VDDQTADRGLDPSKYAEVFGDSRPQGGPEAAPGAQPPTEPVTYARFPAAWVRFAIRCGRAEPAVTTILAAAR
jgi:hypothetical protein